MHFTLLKHNDFGASNFLPQLTYLTDNAIVNAFRAEEPIISHLSGLGLGPLFPRLSPNQLTPAVPPPEGEFYPQQWSIPDQPLRAAVGLRRRRLAGRTLRRHPPLQLRHLRKGKYRSLLKYSNR